MDSQDKFLVSAIIPIKGIERIRPFLLQTLEKCESLSIRVMLAFDVDRNNDEYINFRHEIEKQFKNPPLIFVSEFNSPGLARNSPLKEVKTEWVTFWDSDDLPDPISVISLIDETILRNKQIGAGMFTIARSNSSQQTIFSQTSWSRNPLLDLSVNPGIWRFVFNTKRVRDTLFPEILMGEDQIFLAKLNINPSEVNFSEIFTYKYLKHPTGQLTTSRSSVNEIVSASKILNSELTTTKHSNLNLLFLTNQILTGLLRTELKTKRAYFDLLKNLSRKHPEKLRIIIRNLPALIYRKLVKHG
jgi:hypothetical protein